MRVDEPSDFERVGGYSGLRGILDEFTERVFRDPIIGFLFEDIDRSHLLERELEFASAHLGGPQRYKGRAIAAAHQGHPINSGHFHRRLWLLEQVLRRRGIEDDVIERWLVHNRALEPVVTNGMDCVPEAEQAAGPAPEPVTDGQDST